jgi:division protein CdvB (Snf7/Vps24/ESCRT-III family)
MDAKAGDLGRAPELLTRIAAEFERARVALEQVREQLVTTAHGG